MSALRALLIALKVPQYEECVLGLGFDDVAAYFTFDNADVEAMEEALRSAGVPPGHLEKIMRNVRQCQDPTLRHKEGESPLKFEYGKQMPLLKILRDEVRDLKEQLRAALSAAREQELIVLDEHGKWKEHAKLDKETLLAKNVSSLGLNTGPNGATSERLVRLDSHGAERAHKRQEATRSCGQEERGGGGGGQDGGGKGGGALRAVREQAARATRPRACRGNRSGGTSGTGGGSGRCGRGAHRCRRG